MYSVTVGGPGLVAVGFDRAILAQYGAVWTSTDGLTWSGVPHDELVFGKEGEQWIFRRDCRRAAPSVGRNCPVGRRPEDAAVWVAATEADAG